VAKTPRNWWMICSGEKRGFYTEIIYPPSTRAESSLMLFEYRLFTRMAGGIIYCGVEFPKML
jgi:hypothetical protein